MPRRWTVLVFVLACASTAIANDMKMPMNSGDLKWGPAPPTLPKGAEISVISGNFHVGMGDKLDEKKAVELTAGGYVEAPAKMNHYGWVSSPSVVQIQAQGPFGITYVNPADDPSKQ